ncbi:MAG TPA: copper-binding protein, partial [Candidatus Bathyarchaeia archaeon]|nr:copper-binding protein [Candidatus Bathyarchaeia archaeon]
MSSVLKGFILFAILIGVTGIVPAFALNPVLLQNYTNPTTTGIASTSIPQITVTTDKSSYNDGDKVTIYGTTSDYISGTPVTVQIRNPIGNVVGLNQVEVGTDKTYSITLTAGGSLWQAAGTYSIFVEFGSQDRTAQTTFQFSGSSISKVPNTISVDGTNLSVLYTITNGKVLDIKADTQSKSLIVSIQTTADGLLTITLPRALIDAQTNGQDDQYFVLNDGQEASFQEINKTSTDRTLSIPFTDGTQQI